MKNIAITTAAAAALALAACGEAEPSVDALDETAIPESETDLADDAKDADPRFAETAWQWQSADAGTVTTNLDAAGTYRTAGVSEVLDSGRWQVEDDRLCFDSEVLADEPGCFTAEKFYPLEIGETWETENGEGETARFTRVAYAPIAYMPVD